MKNLSNKLDTISDRHKATQESDHIKTRLDAVEATLSDTENVNSSAETSEVTSKIFDQSNATTAEMRIADDTINPTEILVKNEMTAERLGQSQDKNNLSRQEQRRKHDALSTILENHQVHDRVRIKARQILAGRNSNETTILYSRFPKIIRSKVGSKTRSLFFTRLGIEPRSTDCRSGTLTTKPLENGVVRAPERQSVDLVSAMSSSNITESRIPLEYWDQRSIDLVDEREGVASSSRYPRFSTVTSTDLSNVSLSTTTPSSGNANLLENLIVPLYATIFLLSVVGNSLVLITLARNKRMRTVTNVYLLNLAMSDLLLGVFCMPFTLLGQMLKNFVFGNAMCKLIPYFQAVSVSVGVWTLVAISLERYYAICRPLKSRRWQTQFHAYKMIVVVWAASLVWSAPILVVSRLKSIRGGRHKCREEWPSVGTERAYNIFLDGTLLLIPLIVMCLAYSLIASKLWRGLRREIRQSSICLGRLRQLPGSIARERSVDRDQHATNIVERTTMFNSRCEELGGGTSNIISSSKRPRCNRMVNHRSMSLRTRRMQPTIKNSSNLDVNVNVSVSIDLNHIATIPRSRGASANGGAKRGSSIYRETEETGGIEGRKNSTYTFGRQHAIRSNYMGKSIEAKKKVIRMLFAIVLEFFVCWAPLHVVNTWYLFAPDLVYLHVGSTGISLVQLLAYISSCCNPITYCFMNRKFRQAFLSLFDCYNCWRLRCGDQNASARVTRNITHAGNSEVSANDSAIYLGRTSLIGKSEVVRLLGEEDRV
ncbi:octopamine receptor-like [Belonocnema kinseyi]|uniref:octopamine receptor-like n=1 Tax=Belonocnema kinseyi TaxID=2817044 RepID=UPI00143E0DA6|nr:octopamine receptor-like [Belonocnema kinseyi]